MTRLRRKVYGVDIVSRPYFKRGVRHIAWLNETRHFDGNLTE